LRLKGARNYAAFANLYLLCWLYRFRGHIIDAEGGRVLRTFASAPVRDQPIYTLPYSDQFALDAFPQYKGTLPEFAHCKLATLKTGRSEFITLPKFLAYTYLGGKLTDEELLQTWILPQWALRYGGSLPVDGVAIDRISDDRGKEWFNGAFQPPWLLSLSAVQVALSTCAPRSETGPMARPAEVCRFQAIDVGPATSSNDPLRTGWP
jgi:hypothetical protein